MARYHAVALHEIQDEGTASRNELLGLIQTDHRHQNNPLLPPESRLLDTGNNANALGAFYGNLVRDYKGQNPSGNSFSFNAPDCHRIPGEDKKMYEVRPFPRGAFVDFDKGMIEAINRRRS